MCSSVTVHPLRPGRAQALKINAISLPLTVEKVDANDTLSVTLNNIPEGSVLRSGATEIPVTGTSVTLTEAQLNDLNITPPENYSGTFNIGVSATTTEGGVTSNATAGTITVDVAGVADVPTLSMSVGQEISGAVPLNITATSPDTDGSETVTVTINDIPVGATLNLGGGTTFTATEGNTSFTLSQEQLSGLSIVPVGEDLFDLSVTVTTTESDGDTYTTEPVSLSVDPADLAEGATVVLGAAAGDEDTAIALPISIDKVDESETAEITLSGIPGGAKLEYVDGAGNVVEIPVTDGAAVLSEEQLNGLQITPALDSDVDFDLGVSVVTIDGDVRSDPATGTISIGVDGIADVPNLSVGTGAADGAEVPLNIAATVADINASGAGNEDGAETIQSVTISDIPVGATILLDGIEQTLTPLYDDGNGNLVNTIEDIVGLVGGC